MANQVRHHLTSPSIWTRFLYMVLFSIAYSIAEFVIACIVIFQFFAALFTGRVNEPLLKLGNNLSTYAYQVFQYLTFNSEERPFPFTDWPDQALKDNVWLRDPEPEPESEPESSEPEAPETKAPAAAAPASQSAAESPASSPTGDDRTGTASEQDVTGNAERSDDDRIR